MDPEYRRPDKKRRKRCIIVSVAVAVLLIIVLALAIGLSLRRTEDTKPFKSVFLSRCEAFSGYNCQKIWDAFQKAYVKKDPCHVPVEAYDALMAAAPFEPACNRMLFWSKTKDLVHDFTDKKDCFITLEDTMLGSVLDGLTWCGKSDSSETFTSGCPGWSECENNPVRSFWNRASANFAGVACGDVTVILNGSIATPFHSESIFASIEVKNFNSTKVKNLFAILATQKDVMANCTHPTMKNLEKELEKGIPYHCKEVSKSHIDACASDPSAPCESCW